ncbi:TPA: helix-turn-helix transcriptional regulator [Acinetobacter baumannii]|nr:helix-turn-helix transcriptional regulator [Acinetobacter baumannii]MCT9553489.1 helix-turn-helix transcriptional regulator [Acinetobacter baumannii]MCT9556975.1 helix-turn-helix transcriptional regulator [Acinetobacter baumannii]HCW3751266.1 helix-turn-helix transcriptional regulator [Acinetobacter baumannii]
MRTSSQLFPENKSVTVDDLVTARSEAKNDMGDINALLSAIELSLVEKLKDHNLSKFAFDKTFRLIDIAKTHADLSQDYHNGELSQLTSSGEVQCTVVNTSESLQTKPDIDSIAGFIGRLKLSRKNAGITQNELALGAGISQSTISQIESGSTSFGKYLPAIAKVLGVDAHWLQTGLEDSASVKINQLCLAPATSMISKTFIDNFQKLDINGFPEKQRLSIPEEGFKHDGRR